MPICQCTIFTINGMISNSDYGARANFKDKEQDIHICSIALQDVGFESNLDDQCQITGAYCAC